MAVNSLKYNFTTTWDVVTGRATLLYTALRRNNSQNMNASIWTFPTWMFRHSKLLEIMDAHRSPKIDTLHSDDSFMPGHCAANYVKCRIE
jgi:hypothetical protein